MNNYTHIYAQSGVDFQNKLFAMLGHLVDKTRGKTVTVYDLIPIIDKLVVKTELFDEMACKINNIQEILDE